MTKQEFIKLYKKYQKYKQSDGNYSKKYKVDRDTLKYIIKEIIDKDENLWSMDLNWLDVSSIEDMSGIFEGSKFNGDISKWDVSNVKNMSFMFENSEFDGDISEWNVSNVKEMFAMFSNSKFNRDISNWNVSNVKTMSYMFTNSNFNGNISNWNVNKVRFMSFIFDGSKYNRLDFLLWNIKPSISMRRFFPRIGIYSYEDFIKLRRKKLTDPEFISAYFDKIIMRLCG